VVCILLIIISLYNFAAFLNEYLSYFSPSWHQTYTPLYNKLLSYQDRALIWLAMNEIMLIFYAILHYFGPSGSILRIIITIQFVSYRWGSGNNETRAIFGVIGMGLHKIFFHPLCPSGITNAYNTVQNALKGYAQTIVAV
jgi:hypothetical protein